MPLDQKPATSKLRELSHKTRDFLREVRKDLRRLRYRLLAPLEDHDIRYELTACLKFKNVARFLPEWIEFHHLVGFDHFYLYNNNSTDNYREALQPYLNAKLVTLYDWPETPAFPASDEHCVRTHAHEARWIAFIDDDEFLFSPSGEDIRKVLEGFRDYPAVAVHWLMFGSSGHIDRPEGLVLENYKRCAGEINETIKSIVNPRRVRASKSTHYWLYQHGELAVNENKVSVKASSSNPPTAKTLRINHYWSKSLEDGRSKVARGSVDQWGVEHPRSMDFWHQADTLINQTEDLAIQRFVPELKRRLALRGKK